MKKILIAGANSYIGKAFGAYLAEYQRLQGQECYFTEYLSLRDGSWQEKDFSAYDAVLHVAGIAHADTGKATEEEQRQYYKINCDLAVEVAQKARREGVSQFIYMSSVIVYGNSAKVGKTKHITAETEPQPANFYGDSKWQAEQRLRPLENDSFRMAIVRCPMVYGKGSKGNFPLLCMLAEKAPFFPEIANERSMIYIENLTEFLRLLIDGGYGGVFFPQNAEYVTTSAMVKAIGEAKGRRIPLWKICNPFVRGASYVPGKIGNIVNKAFGSLTLDKQLSVERIEGYQRYSLEESIRRICG